jgi:hypothetical protein
MTSGMQLCDLRYGAEGLVRQDVVLTASWRIPRIMLLLLTEHGPSPAHTHTQVGHITAAKGGGWRAFYRSHEWARLTSVLSLMTYHGYATAGTEGVAVALWALVTSWGMPQQAVCVSAAFAGSAPVTSQLAGG